MKTSVILLASGKGSRMQSKKYKQFLEIHNKPIFLFALETFHQHFAIDEIIIATNLEFVEQMQEDCKSFIKVKKVVSGGKERFNSTFNALQFVKNERVLIHDVARIFVNEKIIDNCLEALNKASCITTAISLIDTIAEINDNQIINIPKRENFVQVQTPQAFHTDKLKIAFNAFMQEENQEATDDCSVYIKHFQNEKLYFVEGSKNNFKITYQDDLLFAEFLLEKGII